jgi:phage terminase large subunit
MEQKYSVVNEYFLPFFESEHKFQILWGGAGSGKSWGIMQKIIKICLEEEGTRVLACRRTKNSIKESVFKQFKSFIEEYGLSKFVQVNKTDMSFQFYNGSEIITTGLDEVERLKSLAELSIIFIEEATEIEKHQFDQLVLRLRGTGKKRKNIIMSFNPVSQLHWIKETFFNDDEKPNPNVFKLHSTFLNNDFIDDGYKETLLEMYSSEGNENTYRIYIKGDWGRIKTNNEFYANFSFGKHVKEDISYYTKERLHLTFDFNVSPYMSLLVSQIIWDDKNKKWRVNVIDEILGISPKNTTEAVCDMFLEKYEGKIFDAIYIYGDASGRSRNPANKLHQYDIIQTILAPYISASSLRVPKANPSILKRRGFISRILNSGYDIELRISKNCKKLIEDIENVTEDADGKKSIKRVRDKTSGAVYIKYGHLSDALDYLLVEAFRGYFDNYQYNPDR